MAETVAEIKASGIMNPPFCDAREAWKDGHTQFDLEELPQCVSIYVSANLIKWKTIELIERGPGREKKKKKEKTFIREDGAERERETDSGTRGACLDFLIILKNPEGGEKKKW